MDEMMTEEVYYYDTLDEAVEDIEIMRAERACDMEITVDNTQQGKVKVTVKCGDSR